MICIFENLFHFQTYLSSGTSQYTEDVDFAEDGNSIIGARFMIQGARIYDSNQEQLFVEELRAVCHASPFNVTVFHPFFIFFDQFLMVFPTTIQCVSVAAVIMMIVSLILIPNPICSLWVAFSILSIELGVIGLMTLWNVNLDSISMINLIMCIGFSVDFSAHISYHFMSRKNMPVRILSFGLKNVYYTQGSSLQVKEIVKDSLYALGLPIIQGAISTILGVIGLALAPSYIFITFFKMVLLVIVLGAMHGLILLPVLLSFLGPGTCCGHDSNSNSSSSNNGKASAIQSKKAPPDSDQEPTMKIPRPKHCSRQNNASSDFSIAEGQAKSNGHFHSDGYLQAATKNKRRTTNRTNHDHAQAAAAIKLHEMYTNRAFKD